MDSLLEWHNGVFFSGPGIKVSAQDRLCRYGFDAGKPGSSSFPAEVANVISETRHKGRPMESPKMDLQVEQLKSSRDLFTLVTAQNYFKMTLPVASMMIILNYSFPKGRQCSSPYPRHCHDR